MNVDLYQPLLQTLQAENQAFEQFLQLLQHEASVLAGQYTHEEIHQIANKKTVWHQEYGKLQNKRRKLLQALELQDSVEALQTLADEDPKFKERLDSLLANAAKAQELNQANGKLIQEYLSHHQHALNVLQSLQPEQAGQTYDSSGKRSKGSAGQHTQIKA